MLTQTMLGKTVDGGSVSLYQLAEDPVNENPTPTGVTVPARFPEAMEKPPRVPAGKWVALNYTEEGWEIVAAEC